MMLHNFAKILVGTVYKENKLFQSCFRFSFFKLLSGYPLEHYFTIVHIYKNFRLNILCITNYA